MEQDGVLTVERRWFGLPAMLLGLVASCWTGLLTGWLAIAGFLVAKGGMWLLVAVIGGGLHLLAAVVLCYIAIAWFTNRTRVAMSPKGIEVTVGPMPWPGARTVPAASVARLAVTEHAGKGFALDAVLAEGRALPIASGVVQLEEAKALEERVARALGNPLLKSGAQAQARRGEAHA
ncbi:MAG: hypothetical protein R3F59_16205 [Myxococcota bacterium]